MNFDKSRPVVVRALLNFLSFAPWKIAILNFSSIFMGLFAGVGMLMVIPLAQLAGVDFESKSVESSPWGFLSYIAEWINTLGFTKDLASILWVYAILAIIIAALTYARTMFGLKFQQDYIKQMRLQMYNLILSARWEYLSSNRSSEYLRRLGGQVQSMQATAHQVIGLLHRLISMIVFTAIMFMVNWKFTLMTFAVAILVGLIVFPVRWSVRDAGERQLAGYQRIFLLLSEHLGSLKMIKSSGHEWNFQEKLRNVSDELEEQQVRVGRAGAIVGVGNSIGMAVGFCIMLYYAVTYLNVPIANFFLLLIIMSRIMPQVTGLQQSIQTINFGLPAYKDIEKTFEETELMQETPINPDISRLGLKSKIEFKNVSFNYPNINKNIVKNLNLVIPKKTTIALVGPSGIGKTTVADMIVGLLKPSQGQILIDNQELNGDLIGQWRRSIAYVTQDTYLFNDSIRNNLAWVNPEATDDELWKVLKAAALKDCIRGLPGGLNSVIGDRGVRLSGGERQRLSIARALLAQPALLVLDEATSSLDNQNEKLIHQALVNIHGTLTVVIIAHRATTIRHADRILDLGSTPPRILSQDEFNNTIAIG